MWTDKVSFGELLSKYILYGELAANNMDSSGQTESLRRVGYPAVLACLWSYRISRWLVNGYFAKFDVARQQVSYKLWSSFCSGYKLWMLDIVLPTGVLITNKFVLIGIIFFFCTRSGFCKEEILESVLWNIHGPIGFGLFLMG